MALSLVKVSTGQLAVSLTQRARQRSMHERLCARELAAPATCRRVTVFAKSPKELFLYARSHWARACMCQSSARRDVGIGQRNMPSAARMLCQLDFHLSLHGVLRTLNRGSMWCTTVGVFEMVCSFHESEHSTGEDLKSTNRLLRLAAY